MILLSVGAQVHILLNGNAILPVLTQVASLRQRVSRALQYTWPCSVRPPEVRRGVQTLCAMQHHRSAKHL
jgi:hypothetical protein